MLDIVLIAIRPQYSRIPSPPHSVNVPTYLGEPFSSLAMGTSERVWLVSLIPMALISLALSGEIG